MLNVQMEEKKMKRELDYMNMKNNGLLVFNFGFVCEISRKMICFDFIYFPLFSIDNASFIYFLFLLTTRLPS